MSHHRLLVALVIFAWWSTAAFAEDPLPPAEDLSGSPTEIVRAHAAEMKTWREGVVVAEKDFNPGIAPFRLEVKRVPVPVTHSYHFIVSLYRGEYLVTSQRVFWAGFTPTSIGLSWSCIDHFTVTFDTDHVVSCDWKWGRSATWTISDGASKNTAGLSPYYFTPRLPPPTGCSVDPKGI